MNDMSPRLARAIEAAKHWPADRQDAAADMLEQMQALAAAPYPLSTEERADLEDALAEARRGEFASDHDVAAMFKRHGL